MKKSINLKNLVLLFIALILLCANLIIITRKIDVQGNNSNNETVSRNDSSNINENLNEQTKSEEEQILEKLKQMNERDRMEYYFSKFVSYIKEEEYSKAYDLLYPDFKNNYFKTEKEFIDYVKKIYPKSVAFSYNDIQRQGYIYVLIINVIDPSKKVGEEQSQRIVIQENGYNDFVLSFQVI